MLLQRPATSATGVKQARYRQAVVTPACKLPVFLLIAEKGVGHAEEGRTVCRGIVRVKSRSVVLGYPS